MNAEFVDTNILIYGQEPAAGVLVQREMESGRAPLASITPNSEGKFTHPEAVAARRKGAAAEIATGFKKKKVSLADLIHSRARAAAENQLATKRILNITSAKLLNKRSRAGDINLVHSCCGGCKRSTRCFSFRIGVIGLVRRKSQE